MVTKEENERLVRVGTGTPMGRLLRRYWHPAVLSRELPENDCPPVRVKILGEELLAFRDTKGRIGLVDAYCPHRRAQLFFGRNEECGIRCVFHGWKFDVDGNCVDLPSEPDNTALWEKMKIKSYPTFETADVIWAYLGPLEQKPSPPDYEWMRAPATHRFVSKNIQATNFLQGLEGGLDTSHSSFLHDQDIAGKSMIRSRDGAPKIEVFPTDYGYSYVSRRSLGKDGEYVRVYQYFMPFQQCRGFVVSMTGKRNEVPKIDGHLWVPIDDENTMVWNWMYGLDEDSVITREHADWYEKFVGRGADDYIPGTFNLKRNLSNDFMIDRHLQKTKTSSGIEGINTQDIAVQESMGSIVDRSLEKLVSSDNAIIVMRKMLLAAISASENGEDPPGLRPETHNNVRAFDCIVPSGVDWREATREHIVARW